MYTRRYTCVVTLNDTKVLISLWYIEQEIKILNKKIKLRNSTRANQMTKRIRLPIAFSCPKQLGSGNLLV